MHGAVKGSCPHSSEDHRLSGCRKFGHLSTDERRAISQSLGVCFNCLGNNHTSKVCRVLSKCRICQRKHHTLLHPKNQSGASEAATPAVSTAPHESASEEVPDVSTNIATHFMKGQAHGQVLLATALVKAESQNGSFQIMRALMDQGSQDSFITESAAQLLRLKIVSKTTIAGIGGHGDVVSSSHVVNINIQSLHDSSFTLTVTAHVLSSLTSVMPDTNFELKNWPEIHSIRLADPKFNRPNKIDILLGAETYCRIIKEGLIKSPVGSPVAQDTHWAGLCQEYLSMGHMEKICNESERNRSDAVYLPHHAVVRRDKLTTKADLRHIVMRWRQHPICLAADILKMYRQIKVAQSDVDFQRIIWREDPDQEIEDFRLLTNRNTDEFDFSMKMSPPPETDTKRTVISENSRLYNPLGWIAPCIITTKVFYTKVMD
ncbi:unnamed protein product [Euphydryas editha]|uniref:Peptidase A2 domain-containing protein n=1 Tax=Euphydryas editha TaxID=104508 RepID=A0AAU9TWC4_EUPED|nr:unnamed protein product [Euphydryas editha]